MFHVQDPCRKVSVECYKLQVEVKESAWSSLFRPPLPLSVPVSLEYLKSGLKQEQVSGIVETESEREKTPELPVIET